MSTRYLAAAALVAVAMAHEAAAQQPGARVRVSLSGARPIEALLLGRDEKGVAFLMPAEHPLAPPPRMIVPVGAISRIDLPVGKRRHGRLGAVIGAVALGLTGFWDPIDTSGSCTGSGSKPCSRAEAVVVAVGALLGALVGHAVETDRWAPIALETLPALSPSLAEVRTAPRPGAAPPAPLHFTVRF